MNHQQYKEGLRARIASLLEALGQGLIEKEEALALSLLSALAGESIFLLGRPGVAKSLLARRLKFAFSNAKAFEYLMNRFSTPDEIFGPVSIAKLKNEDRYERVVSDYLPAAEVVFLDEIWKAGPAIQNSLLTVLNEKKFRNGATEITLPIKALIAASNELPAIGEGLEALWDRFLLRYVVEPIQEKSNFDRLLTEDSQPMVDNVVDSLKIRTQEYREWQKEVATISCGTDILAIINEIRQGIDLYNEQRQENSSLSTVFTEIYVSDRRWKKLVNLLRAAAFFEGRNSIEPQDCFLLRHGLWDLPEQRDDLAEIVENAIEKYAYTHISDEINAINTAIEDLGELIKTSTVSVSTQLLPKVHGDRYYEVANIIQNTATNIRYILKHEFDNLLKASDSQILQLQFWQNYPRQAYAHGIVNARRHPDNPSSQFLEVSNYGRSHIQTLVTEAINIEKQNPPTAAQCSAWDETITTLSYRISNVEKTAAIASAQPHIALFSSKEQQDKSLKTLQKYLNQIRQLKLQIDKVQFSYQKK
jgi:MoxR-like ATPase